MQYGVQSALSGTWHRQLAQWRETKPPYPLLTPLNYKLSNLAPTISLFAMVHAAPEPSGACGYLLPGIGAAPQGKETPCHWKPSLDFS